MASSLKVAYLTDVEGMWNRLASFARDNPLLSLDEASGELSLGAETVFVFGGDAIDRGPQGRRLVQTLARAKERYADRVFLLAGNRDINKIRLWLELQDRPHPRSPESIRADKPALLRWIFENTMGAGDAFSMRAVELGAHVTDGEVVESYLEDLGPNGALARYLGLCQLGVRVGTTLFVHGAVTSQSLGFVPQKEWPEPDVDGWLEQLNRWYGDQIEAFRSRSFDLDGTPAWQGLVAYQAPKPGSRLNQASVVYGRLTDDLQNPHLPERAVVKRLVEQGVGRLVVGHTPAGDVPSVLRTSGFELVMADNSRARVDTGSYVALHEEMLEVRGSIVLDSQERAELHYRIALDEPSRVGCFDRTTGRLVKGPLTDGRVHLWRGLAGYAVEQLAVDPAEVGLGALQPSRFAAEE
jgi:hypothetical protein